MGRTRKDISSRCEGTNTLMRCTILVKSNPIKNVWNQALSPENAPKQGHFC